MARSPLLFAAFAWVLSACGGREREAADFNPASNRPGEVERITGDATPALGPTDACRTGRRILLNEVVNARDLGGIGLEAGDSVACGALFRGGPLSNLSGAGCAEFVERGVRTVVDLRTPSERESAGEAECVLERSRVLLAPMPVPYNVSPEDYITALNTTESVAVVFHALADEASYPLYFHCAVGRDRTGVVAAVILLALGATRADVVDEYLLSLAAGVGAYPMSLAAVLDEIEQRGGVEEYLTSAGVSPSELSFLRARVTDR